MIKRENPIEHERTNAASHKQHFSVNILFLFSALALTGLDDIAAIPFPMPWLGGRIPVPTTYY